MREAAPRGRDRGGVVAGRDERVGEAVEHRRDLAREQLARQLLPVVELGRVAEPEAGEERPAVERRRGAERLEAAPAALAGPWPWRLAGRDERPQLDRRRSRSRRRRARRGRGRSSSQRPPSADAERRERAPQRRAGALRVVLGPEQRRERVAPEPAAPRPRGTRAARSPCGCRRQAAGRRPRSRAARAGRSRAAGRAPAAS